MIARPDRRSFLMTAGLGTAVLAAGGAAAAPRQRARKAKGRARPAPESIRPRRTAAVGKDLPNILWLVSEDHSPTMGCYGDKYAKTPCLDKLAAQGILYLNAFANAPVCAPARSTLITGVYPPSQGTQHMRSRNKLPRKVRFYSQYLRNAGYYTTNCSKTDYNCSSIRRGAWDQCSDRGHWRNRAKGQPFFSIFNIGTTHESCLHSHGKIRHDPAQAKIAPYHPDTPTIRHAYAQLADRVTDMDGQMGKILKDLAADGLADSTIVFYYGDHGGSIARSKRFLYDSGTRVPLLIRFPKKYQHLATDPPGTRTDRLVSFVDFAPTLLSLAGIKIPDHMQGGAFQGKQAAKPARYVHLFRGRMDERYDMMRAVRDKRFKYIRNYMPHLPWAQYLNYLWRAPSMQSWQEQRDAGRTKGPQNTFFEKKPMEELFDIKADPYEVNNLAADPKYRDVLERMRKANEAFVRKIHDTGFLPEAEFLARSKGAPPYDMVRDRAKYDQERIMAAADVANRCDVKLLGKLRALLEDKDSGVRYWGAIGCVALEARAAPAAAELTALLKDPSPNVRVAAAESLVRVGKPDKALGVLGEALASRDEWVALHAANALDNLDAKARPALAKMKATFKGRRGYVRRCLQKALADLRK